MVSQVPAPETGPKSREKPVRIRGKRWIVISALALFLGLAILIAAGSWSVFKLYQARVFYSQGLAAAANGNHLQALACFNAALRNYLPRSWRAPIYQSRGYSFNALGRRDEALADFTEAIRFDPGQSLAYAWRGVIYDDRKDWDRAMDDYSEALLLDPNLGGVLDRRGRIHYQHSEWDKALADYDESIRASPDDPLIYADRALAYAQAGKKEAARASFESATRLGPKVAWIFVEKGVFEQRQGRLREAVADFTAALHLDSQDRRALRQRSVAYHNADQLVDENADLTTLLMLDPRDEFALEHRADLENIRGDKERAEADYSDWIRYTQSATAYDRRARFFVRQGDYSSALDDLREAATVGSVEHSSFYGLAWMLATCPDASLRNGREAVEIATKACEATKWEDSHCLDAMAVAQAENGNIPEAINYERQALALLSVDPVMQRKMEARLVLFQKNKPYHELAPGQIK